jgi:hypothetical protein
LALQQSRLKLKDFMYFCETKKYQRNENTKKVNPQNWKIFARLFNSCGWYCGYAVATELAYKQQRQKRYQTLP